MGNLFELISRIVIALKFAFIYISSISISGRRGKTLGCKLIQISIKYQNKVTPYYCGGSKSDLWGILVIFKV